MGLFKHRKQLLVATLLLPLVLQAQTRLYIYQRTTSGISPAFNSNWNTTSGSTVLTMLPYLDNLTTTFTTPQNGVVAPRKLLIKQIVSQPLQAQTLAGTLTGQFRLNISAAAARTAEGFAYLRLWNTDNTITEIGTLTTTGLTATSTNRTLIVLAIPSTTIPVGSRLVIDLGWNYSTGVNLTTTGSVDINSLISTSDLPVDNTTTTANRSWVEFSQTITFQNTGNGFF